MALLEVKNVSYQYDKFTVVSDISFTLNKGQILGFLGPNGAGKSTTMKMLSGVQHCHSGCVIINGFDIEKQPKQAKQHIGYLPETPPLYSDLTVNEYLKFCAQLHAISQQNVKKAVNNVLQTCQLNDVQNKLIGQLSKGYQQRVGIAQAIIHKPDIIILDEPTVGLDPIQINAFRHLIKKLGKNHAVILSTHILPEVSSICTDVLIINKGKTVYKNQLDALQKQQDKNYQIETNQSFNIEQLQQLKGIKNITEVHSLESIFIDKTSHV